MLELDWRLHDVDGVAFVAAVAESTAPTPRRVRIESRLDAPVQPPRRRGVPERGWDEGGYEGIVPPEGRLALGFACSGEPTEPPVEIVRDERADVEATDGSPITNLTGDFRTAIVEVENPSPTDVLRELGSPAPPRDAVSDSEPDPIPDSEPDAVSDPEPDSKPDPIPDRADEVPDPVAAWLADVATRVERAERLAESRELGIAADAVGATGGLVGIEELLAAVAADRAALRAVAHDAGALAERGAVVEEIPVDAYRRLS